MKDTEPTESPFSKCLFSGLNVVVTGAGRGIGAAIAEEFVSHGANLFAHMGVSEKSTSAHTFSADKYQQQCTAAYADLSTDQGIEGLVTEISAKFPKIDVLVNNAGTMFGRVMADDMSGAHYDKVMDLNARSVVVLTTALLPLLKRSGSGSIVNTTSISATTGGSPGSSIYSASKAFVSTYTRSLARELAPHNIRVNALSPGTIDTDFHTRYSSKEKLEATARAIPLGRLGTPQDCAPACLFFASHRLSGYITGQILEINGGQLMG